MSRDQRVVQSSAWWRRVQGLACARQVQSKTGEGLTGLWWQVGCTQVQLLGSARTVNSVVVVPTSTDPMGILKSTQEFKAPGAGKEHTNEVRGGGRDLGVRRPGAGLGRPTASMKFFRVINTPKNQKKKSEPIRTSRWPASANADRSHSKHSLVNCLWSPERVSVRMFSCILAPAFCPCIDAFNVERACSEPRKKARVKRDIGKGRFGKRSEGLEICAGAIVHKTRFQVVGQHHVERPEANGWGCRSRCGVKDE